MDVELTLAQTEAIAPSVQRFSEAEAVLQREVALLLLGMGHDPERWTKQIAGRNGTFVLELKDADEPAER